MINGARELALRSLVRCEKEGRYSNIELGNTLDHAALSPEDRGLYTRLVYGVTERRITLDTLIRRYVMKPMDKLTPEVLEVLRMGFYQIVYMNSVPDNAAVNESVELIKRLGEQKASGFVNRVLRHFLLVFIK